MGYKTDLGRGEIDNFVETCSLTKDKIKGISATTTQRIQYLLQQRDRTRKTEVLSFKPSEWLGSEGEDEDYRNMSLFPTYEEIFSVARGEIAAKVKPNIIDGKYKNVMHYLDIQFRLLREDCIAPLREGTVNVYLAYRKQE
jgi:hypothetical protein